MNFVLIIAIYVVKYFVISCIDFFSWPHKVWEHIESRFDVDLWHVASICHPAANEEVFNEIIGQLKCYLIKALYFGYHFRLTLLAFVTKDNGSCTFNLGNISKPITAAPLH